MCLGIYNACFKVCDIRGKKRLLRQNPFDHYEISMKEVGRGYMLKEEAKENNIWLKKNIKNLLFIAMRHLRIIDKTILSKLKEKRNQKDFIF